MIDCLIDWLKVSEIRSFWKVKWEGIKGLPKLSHLHFMISWIQIIFNYKTLERRWHDFFHLIKWKGFLKIFEFHLETFPIQKLYATQWFSWKKRKWLLQIIWNMSWKFQRNPIKRPFENKFQFGCYHVDYSFAFFIFMHFVLFDLVIQKT